MATKQPKKARETLTQVAWQHDGTAVVQVFGQPALTFNPMKASLLNRNYAQQFGWDNRIKNKTSVTADPATGKTDTAEKYRLARELIEFYEQGGDAWDMKSAGGGGVREDAGLVVQALTRLWKRDVDAVEAGIRKLAARNSIERDAQLKILAKSPDVVKVVGAIKAERAAANKTVDASSYLDELDNLPDADEDDEDDAPTAEEALF
jgi:hypothetical protein